MRSRPRFAWPFAICFALSLNACGVLPTRTSDPVVDGEVIGPVVPCMTDGMTALGCARLEAYARREIRDGLPGKPAVTTVTFHGVGTTIGPNGEIIRHTTGVSWWIIVLDLADGTRRAVGVGCGVDVTPDMDCLASPAP